MKLSDLTKLSLALLLLSSLFCGCRDVYQPEEAIPPEAQSARRPFDVALSLPERRTEVTFNEALRVLSKESNPSLRSITTHRVKSSFTLSTSSGTPALYVINYEPRGYAIISASRKHKPLLAYSKDGFIPSLEEASPVVRSLLSDYVLSVERAISQPDSLTRLARLEWEMLSDKKLEHFRAIREDDAMYKKTVEAISQYLSEGYKVYRYLDIFGEYKFPDMSESSMPDWYRSSSSRGDLFSPEEHYAIDRQIMICASKVYNIENHTLILIKENTDTRQVSPLLTTSWGQGYHPKDDAEMRIYECSDQYNMYIPNHYSVGCTPVAVAQIMRYHRHPSSFNWDAMPDDYPTKTTARFLLDVARGMETTFKEGGSPTYKDPAEQYLKIMGYSVEKTDDSRIGQLREELNSHRPICVWSKEQVTEKGHTFVLDGYEIKNSNFEAKVMTLPDAPESYLLSSPLECVYSDNKYHTDSELYHLNLGWGGFFNGYYTFSNFAKFNIDRSFWLITPNK